MRVANGKLFKLPPATIVLARGETKEYSQMFSALMAIVAVTLLGSRGFRPFSIAMVRNVK